jgi:hypothetical protein
MANRDTRPQSDVKTEPESFVDGTPDEVAAEQGRPTSSEVNNDGKGVDGQENTGSDEKSE